MTAPNPEPSTPSVETLRLVHDEVSARAAALDANATRLDTKATTLLGFTLALATILATQQISGWLKIAPLAVLAVAASFGLQALQPRPFRSVPEPRVLVDELAARSEPAVLTILSEAKTRAILENQILHEAKARAWRKSQISLTLAAVLLVSAIAIGGFDGRRLGQQPAQQPAPVPTTSAVTPADR